MLKKKIRNRIWFGLILISILIIPSWTSASDLPATALPIWSDRLGEYRVLVDCSDDGKYVIAGSDSGTLRMYSNTGKILWSYQKPEKSIMSVAISGNGESVAAAFFDPRAPSYDAGGEILYFNRGGNLDWKYYTGSTVHRVALSDAGDIVLASGDSALYLFDRTGTLQKKFRLNGTIWGAALAGDGSRGVAGLGRDWGEIFVTDANGTATWNYPTGTVMRAVGISSSGEAIAGVDNYHLYWFNHTQTPAWDYTSSTGFRDIAVSSDGEYCAAASQYFLRFFNRTGSLLWEYEDRGYVGGVAMSANGNEIIAGMSGGTILFDQSGTILWKYEKGSASVSASEDGNYFVAGSASEIYFFNRYGTTKIMNPTISESPVKATGSLPVTTPSAPLSIPCIIIAIGFISAIVILQKGRVV